MGSKKPSDADEISAEELNAEIEAEARRVVLERRKRQKYSEKPWWTCSLCGFKNHPRAHLPGWIHCEQCGKERDDRDLTSEVAHA